MPIAPPPALGHFSTQPLPPLVPIHATPQAPAAIDDSIDEDLDDENERMGGS